MLIITAEEVRRLLNYDPETGIFTNRVFRGLRALEGAKAGSLTTGGYIEISIRKRKYAAHRLAWLYVYGKWPRYNVDHINRIKTDNRVSNLRDVTQIENGQNKSLHRNNTSGVTGIDWHRQNKRWRVRIRVNWQSINLGYYVNLSDAIEARKTAETKYHPYRPQ